VLRPALTEHDGVARVLPSGSKTFEFHTVDRNAGGLGKVGCHAGILPTDTGHLLTGFCGSVVGVRADRLMAILLLLQHREQVTAAEVARELEDSERTARRDLDALGMAGVPVYSVQGRGGGWRLVGGARTDLSGLTASEARALFLVAGPASSVTPAVKAARRKLVHALPEPVSGAGRGAAWSLVMDPQPWGSSRVEPRPPRFLDELQDAVIRGIQVRLGYVDRERTETERTVHPLGIVPKARRGTSSPTPRQVGGPSGSTACRPSSRPAIPCIGPRTSTLPRAGARSRTRSTASERPSRPGRCARPTG